MSKLPSHPLMHIGMKLTIMPNSENASMDEASDDDESNTNQSRTSSPPSLQSFESPLKAVSVDGKSLDGLGYLNNNADILLGYLKTVST